LKNVRPISGDSIYLILVVVVAAFIWTSWPTLRSFVYRLEAAAFGLVVMVLLLGVYVWRRMREISELRASYALEQREVTPENDKQLEQLFGMISRSQQGYRDLIDSFDDILIALSLDGEIRAANRRFTELVGLSFQQIIGKKTQRISGRNRRPERRRRRGSHAAFSGTPQLVRHRTSSPEEPQRSFLFRLALLTRWSAMTPCTESPFLRAT